MVGKLALVLALGAMVYSCGNDPQSAKVNRL